MHKNHTKGLFPSKSKAGAVTCFPFLHFPALKYRTRGTGVSVQLIAKQLAPEFKILGRAIRTSSVASSPHLTFGAEEAIPVARPSKNVRDHST